MNFEKQAHKNDKEDKRFTGKNGILGAAAIVTTIGGQAEAEQGEGFANTSDGVTSENFVESGTFEAAIDNLNNFTSQFEELSRQIENYLNTHDQELLKGALYASSAGSRVNAELQNELMVMFAVQGNPTELDNPMYSEAVTNVYAAQEKLKELKDELFETHHPEAGIADIDFSSSSEEGAPEQPLSQESVTTSFDDAKVWDMKSVLDIAVAESVSQGNMDALELGSLAEQLAQVATSVAVEAGNLERSIDEGNQERIDRYSKRLQERFEEYSKAYTALKDAGNERISEVLSQFEPLSPTAVERVLPSVN